MELIKDNRKIVDRITINHIDQFVGLLQKNKNYRYLDLLSVLCVCDGVSIPDNQNHITKRWLMEGDKNCVYYTDLGQKIDKDSNVVYVSTNKQRTWTPLVDFVKMYNGDENLLFLEHQLDLFGKLCYGRNEFPMKIITEKLNYLTWAEAYLCLSNEELPDQLRAKYCHLIIGLFIDVGKNVSILDRINLTYIYDDLDDDEVLSEEDLPTSGIEHFQQLHNWLSKFFDRNQDMTASLIGHNVLIEQVMRLVHYLVRFGYYKKREDIKSLLTPFLNLLDGRNDKPYEIPSGGSIPNDVLKRYRNDQRYKQSPETKAISDAKVQAIKVLDLFFNYQFNLRLKVSAFKKLCLRKIDNFG